jgi:uncharacterized membrane protein HdeD (DUF308 family)
MTATSSSMAEVFGDVRRYGLVLIVAGTLGTIAGVLAILYPDITLLALALIAGINIMLLGVASLVDSFVSDDETGGRVLAGVLGVLGIVAGLAVMRRPGESLLALLVILGIWLVVTGIVDLVRAFAAADGRGLRLIVALVDIAFGSLILALPKLTLGTLALLVGISFLVRGVIMVVTGVGLRRAGNTAGRDASRPAVTA